MKTYNDPTSGISETHVTQDSESVLSRRRFGGLMMAGTAALAVTASGLSAARAEGAKYVTGDVIMGDPNAPVELIEYASLTCPHCASFHINTLPDLKKNYIDTGKVKYIVREFPFDSPGLGAAMLARCGGEDRYHALYDVLFQEQRDWATSGNVYGALEAIAKRAGLSSADFEACMQDKDLTNMVVGIRKEGMDKYNVQATPTLIINGDVQDGGALSYEELSKIIDDILD